jgi:predicted RNase H-like HicB family nuclease
MAMPLFTARAGWDGEWWVIVVSDVPGALTHVRHRDDAAARLREAIGLSLDIPQDSFNVQVDFDVIQGPASLQLEGI